MTYDKKSKAKEFFDLGIAFAQFSAKANEENYSSIRKIAVSLELALPERDRIEDQVWWDFEPPPDWFEASDGGSFRNHYEMGMLSYLRFLLALPPLPNTRIEQIDASVQKLTALFKVERVPEEILDKYLAVLDMGGADEANTALREFVLNIHKSIDVNTKDRLKFNRGEPAPSCFEEDILDAIAQVLEEASVCYENKCYTATITLCGKVIETLIKNVYTPVTGKEIYTINRNKEQIERSFKNMCNDLRDQGMLLSRGVGEQLDLIYAHRNGAIHEIRIPSQDEAYSIALLTNDAMNHVFEYCNSHMQS